jgi:hypothetical protein
MIDAVVGELSMLNPDVITPIEALELLNEWKRRFTAEGNAVPLSPAVVPAAGSQSKPRSGKADDVTPSLFD